MFRVYNNGLETCVTGCEAAYELYTKQVLMARNTGLDLHKVCLIDWSTGEVLAIGDE